MRYQVETRLRPGQVFARAREFFGPAGRFGLDLTTLSPNRIAFAGAGGFITITAHRALDRTRLEFEVYQLDMEAQAFIATLPGPESWLGTRVRRVIGCIRR